MNPLDMLTEDCWIEVFRKIVSAVDLKACSETCVLFETILDRRKSSWKLGVVIPFIFNYLNLQEELDEAWEQHEQNGYPDDEPVVPFWQPILRTRLVSRTLCHAVDTYLETNFDRGCYPHRWRPASYSLNQEGVEKIDEFLGVFETYRGNPFIGRNVSVRPYHPNDDQLEPYDEGDRQQESLYLGKVVQFLDTFGHDIWTFTFRQEEDMQHLRFCKALQLLLSHLPNIRTLSFRHDFHQLYPIFMLDEIDQEEGMDELIPYLTTHPLPDLPHLEHLDTRDLSFKMGQPMVEKYCPHLKSLRMHDSRPISRCVERFNCLKELELTVDSQNSLTESLRTLRSPLEKLSVKIELNRRQPSLGRLYDIQGLLLNVRHLPLKDLKIESECIIGESAPISPDLKIESIERLEVIADGYGISFNFLQCFTKLAEVKITFDVTRRIISQFPRKIPETLFVREPLMHDDLYSSDIWERIPSLKKFSVNVGRYGHYRKGYNRDGYEEWRLDETEKVLRNN